MWALLLENGLSTQTGVLNNTNVHGSDITGLQTEFVGSSCSCVLNGCKAWLWGYLSFINNYAAAHPKPEDLIYLSRVNDASSANIEIEETFLSVRGRLPWRNMK